MLSTMTPKEGHYTHAAFPSSSDRVASPLVHTMSRRHHPSTQDYDSIKTAVHDMEAKIMEKVSMLTLDSSDEVEEPTEVSFTAEDITDLTETPASTTAPSAMTIIVVERNYLPLRPFDQEPSSEP